DDARNATRPVEGVRVGDADAGVGRRVGPGGVAVTASARPGHIVEDVSGDLPETRLVGVEGPQDVLGVPEVVVLHFGPATGTGVDARLVDADVVVVVNVGDATAQERRAGVDVLVQVVVERDE